MGCGAGYTFRISHYITLDTSGPPFKAGDFPFFSGLFSCHSGEDRPGRERNQSARGF